MSTDALVTESEFLDLITAGQGLVDTVVGSGTSSLPPILLALTKRGLDESPSLNTIEIRGDFNEHNAKRSAMRQCGKFLYGQRCAPIAAVLISEAWMAVQTAGDSQLPADCPDREEVIVVQARGAAPHLRAFTRRAIARNAHDQIEVAGPWLELVRDGVQSALLDQFFKGFMSAALAERQ
jgi:hypothetical protein